MVISDFAIKKPLVTVVAMLCLVVFGLVSLMQLETDEFPEINPPILFVGVLYPGGSPEGVEREILDPIEEAIAGIEGVDTYNGTALDSYAQLVVQFEFSKDPQEASTEVRNAISGIRGELPPEMEEPIIQRFSPSDLPIVQIALSSDAMSPADLTQLADDRIGRELRSISGVSRVTVAGAQQRELTINLRPTDLAAYGLSPAQVVQAVQLQNLAAPVGRVNTPGSERSIRLEGRIERPEDFARIAIGQGNGGRTVYLGEVADVEAGAEEQRSLALYNGRDAVGVNVVKSSDASTTTVAEEVLARVEEIQASLPPGVRLDVVQNSGTRVEASVDNVVETLIEGVFLTILVVFVFLNSWRSTVITGLALPVSMLAAFIAVYAFGFTLNTMSLLGLTLAIGIIIDDAIVVRENIVRHVEMGEDHMQASMEGTDEIGLAVAATTLAIVSVFVPIAFISGIAGQWFKPFALTIASSVLVSLFVSFSLDPMLSAYWPDPHVPEDKKNLITRTLDKFNRWFDRQATGYRRVVAWALDHPWTMMALTAVTFIAALAMPVLGLVKGGLFPDDDQSEFTLNVRTPPGSDITLMRQRLDQIGTLAREMPEVRYTYATATSQTGAVDDGNVYVRLVPIEEREIGATALAQQFRERVARIPGIEVSIAQGFDGSQKAIQLQLRGADRAALQTRAEEMAERLRTVPGAVDVGLSTRGRKPELSVDLDRDAALASGLTVAQVAQSLRPAFAGIDAGDWVDPDGETRDVTVRYAPEYRADGTALVDLPLRVAGAAGVQTVTLGQVATVRESRGPAVIEHVDGDPVVTVGANVGGDYALSDVNAEINKAFNLNPRGDTDLGSGVRLVQGGQTEAQQEIFGSMLLALGAGIMLMYLILVLQFGSFLDPIAILMSLPLSLIGVMLGLLVAGATINIMSMIGVILLMGIVAKNAILLIDFAKEAKASGMSTRDALIEAGGIRLRPILMTTFALVAGMIPIAVGSGEGALFRRPLGAAVIGGTLTSTFLTLLVIPTVWELIDKMRTKVVGRLRRNSKTDGHQSAHAHASDTRPSVTEAAPVYATSAVPKG